MATAEKRSITLDLQPRDIALLRELFECRVMSAEHIATLLFDSKREYTKKRLQKLKAEGFIRERRRQVSEPAILFLTRKAFGLLQSQGELATYPQFPITTLEKRANVSSKTLQHELEVMDVKAAIHAGISNQSKFSVAQFTTWPQLCEFTATHPTTGANILVKPDGFLRIHEKEEGTKGYYREFFLELDRSTEKQDILLERARCYVDFYRSGGYAVRNGAGRSEFQQFPFRVLMVFKTAERRNNTAERLLSSHPPILTQICLTTFAEVTANPLGPIWIELKDYRNVTDGTHFDTSKLKPTFVYRRQPEREALVEAKIRKFSLLDG